MSTFKQITDFDGSRDAHGQQARVEDTRAAAGDFRKAMLAGPKARYFRSFDLVRAEMITLPRHRNVPQLKL